VTQLIGIALVAALTLAVIPAPTMASEVTNAPLVVRNLDDAIRSAVSNTSSPVPPGQGGTPPGQASRSAAYDVTLPVTVTDGMLNISFGSSDHGAREDAEPTGIVGGDTDVHP